MKTHALTDQQLVDMQRMVVAETLSDVVYNEGPAEVWRALQHVIAEIKWPARVEPLTFEQAEDVWRAYHGNLGDTCVACSRPLAKIKEDER